MTNKRIEDTNEDIDLMKMVEEYEKEEAAEQMAQQPSKKAATPANDSDSAFDKRTEAGDDLTRVMTTKDLSMQDKTLTILTSAKQAQEERTTRTDEEEELVLKSTKSSKNKGGQPKKPTDPDKNDKQNKIITGIIIAVVAILLIVAVVVAMNFMGGSDDSKKKEDQTEEVDEKDKEKDDEKDNEKDDEKEDEKDDEKDNEKDCSAEDAKLDELIEGERKTIATLQGELKTLYTKQGEQQAMVASIQKKYDACIESITKIETSLKEDELSEEEITDLNNQLTALNTEYGNIGKQLNTAKEELAATTSEITKKENGINESNKKKYEYESQKGTCNAN